MCTQETNRKLDAAHVIYTNVMSSMFPKHVVEVLSSLGVGAASEKLEKLARSHENVTILFMDVVGESRPPAPLCMDGAILFTELCFVS